MTSVCSLLKGAPKQRSSVATAPADRIRLPDYRSGMPLSTGARHVLRVRVGPEMTPAHLAPIVVLATPEMIRLMEEASTMAVEPSLEDGGRTTVGTHVDVSHEAAAREGDEVQVEGELVAIDGPRLTFQVEARVGDRIIGRGTHRRYVVDRSRFAG